MMTKLYSTILLTLAILFLASTTVDDVNVVLASPETVDDVHAVLTPAETEELDCLYEHFNNLFSYIEKTYKIVEIGGVAVPEAEYTVESTFQTAYKGKPDIKSFKELIAFTISSYLSTPLKEVELQTTQIEGQGGEGDKDDSGAKAEAAIAKQMQDKLKLVAEKIDELCPIIKSDSRCGMRAADDDIYKKEFENMYVRTHFEMEKEAAKTDFRKKCVG